MDQAQCRQHPRAVFPCMVLSNVTFLAETYIDWICQGVLPRCSSCNIAAKIRQLEGKRPLSVPVIHPDIVLYGDTFNTVEEHIISMANQDGKTADLLLVVGTSLQIPGTRETKDKLQGMGDSQEVVKEYALVHQDSRPLWRYY